MLLIGDRPLWEVVMIDTLILLTGKGDHNIKYAIYNLILGSDTLGVPCVKLPSG